MINFDVAILKAEIDAAKQGEKKAIVRRLANSLNISESSIYRALSKVYGKQKTVTREKVVSDFIIDEVAKLKVESENMGLGKRELKTEDCLEILSNRGIDVSGISVSTVNRRLREKGFRKEDVIVRVEADYANQQHQLDFSRSKYFQISHFDKDANDYVLKVTGKTLFYKENETKLRTWLIGLTDAYSRISLVRAVAATGESAILGIEFLNFAYNRAEDEHPLRYLPDILKTDNGSFAKDKAVKQMFQALEIVSELSEAYKHRGVQKRESEWKALWQSFELKLATEIGGLGKTLYLNEYNDLAHEFMIKRLDLKHPMRSGLRGDLYRQSMVAHPGRTIDIDLREAAFNVVYRTVAQDLTVSVDNQKFECKAYALGQRIKIYRTLNGEYYGETVDVFNKPFQLTPTQGFVELGNFEHRQHKTYKQQIEGDVKKAQEEKKAKKTEALKTDSKVMVLGHRTKKQEAKTNFAEVKNSDSFVFASKYDAKVYIANKVKDFEMYADIFDELLENDLSRKSIDDVIAAVGLGSVWKIG